jgi:septum site-determining protein MinC
MAVASRANAAAFQLKSAALTLVSVVLRTPDLQQLARELDERLAHTPELFDQDPVVIDVTPVRDETIDFDALCDVLRRHRMRPVAVKGASEGQLEAARAVGLGDAPEGPAATSAKPDKPGKPAANPPVLAAPATLIVDKPLRSGQQVYARGGDLIVAAAVNFGAEVIADGSIHVYAPLRGRAIAGARGDTGARIFALVMEPQLVSIAGVYRTVDAPLAADIWSRPAQVRLADDRLQIDAL